MRMMYASRTRPWQDLRMPTAPPLLILWDIDQTLVSTDGVGRDMYRQAFERVIGRPLVHFADMAGRTEQAITRETLELNGVEPDDERVEAFYTALGEAARTLRDRMREHGRALPGAREALTALAADGAVQSVVTGNLPGIAEVKLESFGLDGLLDLEIGAYGDVADNRAVLVRLALELAEAKHEHAFGPESIVVIGDTPHDVKGALDNGVLAVAVATGFSSMDELYAAGAHLVLPDLLDLAKLNELVLARRAE